MIKNKSGTLVFSTQPVIRSFASVAGKKESEGPLREDFDKLVFDPYAGQKSFEKAEMALVKEAVSLTLKKGAVKAGDVDLAFGGDLLNQCIASSFGMKEFSIPYIGLYGACSTMALGLIEAAIAVDSGAARTALAAASSHYCTAERQYRYPLEYGCQRATSSQHTVTGAGCALITNAELPGSGVVHETAPAEKLTQEPFGQEKRQGDHSETDRGGSRDNRQPVWDENRKQKDGRSEAVGDGLPDDGRRLRDEQEKQRQICLHSAAVGIITDQGVTDQNNMGAAMAPAAADTILRYLRDMGARPADFDGVFTGDLGRVGSELLYALLDEQGLDLRKRHHDCGKMIFSPDQDAHAGGSGCGCCASVLCGHILKRMRRGELNNILFIATGALLSPTTVLQKESIPSIAHLVNLRTR